MTPLPDAPSFQPAGVICGTDFSPSARQAVDAAAETLLGSVATTVMARSDRPLLIVRPPRP